MNQTEESTLTIEGVKYKIADLSQNIKEMLALYQRWSTERAEQLADLNKTDAALKTIMSEIVIQIKNENAKPDTSDDVPVDPDKCHPSHKTTVSMDSSTFDEICVVCGARDIAGGGWGDLSKPCKKA